MTIDGWSGFPTTFEENTPYTLTAVLNSHDGYKFYVNSNNPEDHKDSATKDTNENPKILQLQVTIQNEDTSKHIKAPANPAGTRVNLFDYWVDIDGSTGANDLLGKSDVHDGASSTNVPRTGVVDWNKGINKGRLLLFGDGNIHAGLWNKGAGAGSGYGKSHAGMMGIVEPKLQDGYPLMNTGGFDKLLELDASEADREDAPYKGISDWELCGDHNDAYGQGHRSDDVKNISNTVRGQWENGDASLNYLFDPGVKIDCKRSYTDVQGLFQIDRQGYYYYDIRQNFAEYNKNSNQFILYDAPAVQRTDNAYENGGFGGERSVGNFLPFNTAGQVFDGVEDGKLYSSENVRTDNNDVKNGNYLNHHLGMTLEINFRQPESGMINMGANGNQPMTFLFSGDDDVWVFVDDVLVLDLGGIHSEIYGVIDFATGKVSIGQSWKTNGFPKTAEGAIDIERMQTDGTILTNETTLYQQFDAAGAVNTTQWKENTFASDTDHTLKMFFLERGNYDSSLAVRFNLQPQLSQKIKKVDQNGMPMEGVEFQMFPAVRTNKEDEGAIECFYTDSKTDARMRVANNKEFYIKQEPGTDALCRLNTDGEGAAQFVDGEGNPFNFADRGERYYILKETKTPPGYRPLPVDIVLRYDPVTSMLSVANRWTTGAYACSVSNISGTELTYGAFDSGEGNIGVTDNKVSDNAKKNGLVVAVPMLWQESPKKWIALYGSNLYGFDSVPPAERTAPAWRAAVLEAALRQAVGGKDGERYAGWHLDWDAENNRLTGMLDDLPGLASRYQINGGEDMRMVYGIIEPAALQALGIDEGTAEACYEALGDYVKNRGVEATVAAIMGVTVSGTGSGRGFSFLNVDQFNRNFRSLIYIPNEQRELWVMKVDQNGVPRADVEFTLFKDEACQTVAAMGVTDDDGRLIFSPSGDGSRGHAKMVWAQGSQVRYYLRETGAPDALSINNTVIPVVVGTYSIYADAGDRDNDVSVLAGVGRLTQTMRQYAMDNDVDITLRDITAVGQYQETGSSALPGQWKDMELKTTLENNPILRSMNLHYQKNAVVDYGLHDADGGKNFKPFFVTDTGFIRARVMQNYPALLKDGPYAGESTSEDTNKDNLGSLDLTSLFSLLNIVVVTDREKEPVQETGQLLISKTVTNSGQEEDYTRNFEFTIALTKPDGTPLEGKYNFYGTDRSGYISNGSRIPLHHDESIVILGLPVGTKFEVRETLPGTESDAWYVIPANGIISGAIQKDKTQEAAFVNSRVEPLLGSLIIEKAFGGAFIPAETADKEFTFTVKGPNDYTVTITGAGKYVLTGLTPGEYQVTENRDGIDIRDYTVSVKGEGSATVTAGGEAFVTVVNTYTPEGPATGSLLVKKTVTGSDGSKIKEFTFTITLKKADGSTLGGAYSYTGSKNGALSSGQSVKLKHGEYVKISGLPIGTHYMVEESDCDGYTVTSSGSTGTIAGGQESEAFFINEKKPDKDPENPPKDPENPPKDPENPPKDPENPPKAPENPPKDPENPPDRPTKLPDPNDPDSPDTVTIWEDGVPKTYIKVWDPEKGEWVYIPENEVPLIPMTEDTLNCTPWEAACLASLAGLCAVSLKKKRPEEEA